MEDNPEVKIARRLIKVKKLKHPIDIFSLLKDHADLEFAEIPESVDGICLNLKVKNKTKVIINSKLHKRRMIFTAAHELGHIIIPWHVGSIIDINFDEDPELAEYIYRGEEAEANRFASEILMPREWILELYEKYKNPKDISMYLHNNCDISLQAITLKLRENLPPGYIFVRLRNKEVFWSGKTKGTVSEEPKVGDNIDIDSCYPVSTNTWKIVHNIETYCWWHFSDLKAPPKPSNSNWRNTLTEIFAELGVSDEDKKYLWSSITAQLAVAKQKSGDSIDSIYSALLQKKASISSYGKDFDPIVQHNKFDTFLIEKAYDFFERKNNISNT